MSLSQGSNTSSKAAATQKMRRIQRRELDEYILEKTQEIMGVNGEVYSRQENETRRQKVNGEDISSSYGSSESSDDSHNDSRFYVRRRRARGASAIEWTDKHEALYALFCR